MSPGITGVHLRLNSTCTMVFRRAETKTVQSTLGDAVDQVFMDLPTHEDIKLFVDKDIKV